MRARDEGFISRHEGFTYIGILVFVAVIGLASAMTLEVASTATKRSAERELRGIGREFSAAFKTYYLSSPKGTPAFPHALEDLLHDPRFPGLRRHLRRIYADPLTGRAAWGTVPAPGGGIMGVYSLAPGTPMGHADNPLKANLPPGTPKGGYADWMFGYDPNAMLATMPGAQSAAQ